MHGIRPYTITHY